MLELDDMILIFSALFELVHWSRMQGNRNNEGLDKVETDLLEKVHVLKQKRG